MSQDSVLNTSIEELPLCAELKVSLIGEIWNGNRNGTLLRSHEVEHRHAEAYLNHYEDACQLALSSCNRESISRVTHRDIIEVINRLRLNEPRHTVLDNLITKLSNSCKKHDNDYKSAAECLIALATRIWLMCKINLIGEETRHDQKIAFWDGGGLHDFVANQFSRKSKLHEPLQLEKQFQARNLERLGGIEVLWTDNMLDHLRVHDPSHPEGQMRVSIFYHARFLEYHQEFEGVFPEGLVNETMRTLALLFPRYDSETQRWFKKQCAVQPLDPMASVCNPLEPEGRTVESFEYWRDRLTILKQAYDEAEPKNIAQWWFDRRRRVQWATFWVAALVLALTIFFGVVQSIEGALQVYKAYHPS